MGAEDSVKKLKRTKSGNKKRVENPQIREEATEIKQGKKRIEKLRNKKRKNGASPKTEVDEHDVPQINEVEDRLPNKRIDVAEPGEDKLQKLRKKKRKGVKIVKTDDELHENADVSEPQNDNEIVSPSPREHSPRAGGLNEADTRRRSKSGKSKKTAKTKKKSQLLARDLTKDKLPEKIEAAAEDEVYEMSSGDEDYSKGMRKWIMKYHQSRPGPKVLQERIDDFIMAHEAKEEQARKEREAQAAEGGWTVVVQQKGRKKTTDAESGIAVGSVAQAAVLDNMTKKKNKDIGINFYGFQKREAQKSEIMMLQSKFEQDKKRIQQMRAARKFRPY